jgi:zinc and cadmium transporter
MPLIVWIVLFCLVGGVLSVLAAALFLVLQEPLRNRMLPHLISFDRRSLEAAFGLLPHVLDHRYHRCHLIPMAVLLGCWGFSCWRKW